MSVSTEMERGRPQSPLLPVLIKIAKTLGSIAVTMLGLLLVTFLIGRVMPIDPVISVLGERATKETYDATYVAMGLDKPLIVQFLYYIWDVV